MSHDPRISVVIPTHDREESLERTLRALAAQTLPQSDYEVIVSMDGSPVDARRRLERCQVPYHVRALWQPKRGRAAACNAGARAARGSLLVFLDDDMEPVPGFLSAHLASHAEGTRRGVVGAAPIVLNEHSSPVAHYRQSSFHNKLERMRMGRRDGLPYWDVYMGNFSLHREAFLEAGGFDESFTLHGREDYELALRLQGVGIDLCYDPDALAHQHYEKDFTAMARDIFAGGKSTMLLFEKHPEIRYDQRLGTFEGYPRQARYMVRLLLAASRHWKGLPALVVRGVAWAERHPLGDLFKVFDTALLFVYCLGVEDTTAPGRFGTPFPTAS